MADFQSEIKVALAGRNYPLATQIYIGHLTHNPNDGDALLKYLDMLQNSPLTKKDKILSIGGVISNIFSSKGSPQQRLEEGIKTLSNNPYNLTVLYKLGKAAHDGAMYDTAIAAFNSILKFSSQLKSEENRELMLQLGRTYSSAKQYKNALNILQRFEKDPKLPEDIKELIEKDLPAQLAAEKISEGSTIDHATQESKDLAASKKPGEKQRLDIQRLEDLLSDSNLDPNKAMSSGIELANSYLLNHEFDNAVTAIEKAQKRSNSSELDKKLIEVKVSKMDYEIEQLRTDLSSESKLKALEEVKWAFVIREYDILKKRSDDPEIHLILGEGLYLLGQRKGDEEMVKKAISELQVEYEKDDHINKSKLLLAKCFFALGFPNLAETFMMQYVSREGFANKQKEVVLGAYYWLGLIRETNDDNEGALKAYLRVIEKDINFKDVLEKIKKIEASMKKGLKSRLKT